MIYSALLHGGTVYPFDVSYSALLVTKLTETSVASVYLYLIYSATGAFDLSMQSAICTLKFFYMYSHLYRGSYGRMQNYSVDFMGS